MQLLEPVIQIAIDEFVNTFSMNDIIGRRL